MKLKDASQDKRADIFEVDTREHNKAVEGRKVHSVGGNRHLSAARFVQDNPEALAIVKSEDGIVSGFVAEEIEGKLCVVRYKRLELTLS